MKTVGLGSRKGLGSSNILIHSRNMLPVPKDWYDVLCHYKKNGKIYLII